jgi:hypothetical protein
MARLVSMKLDNELQFRDGVNKNLNTVASRGKGWGGLRESGGQQPSSAKAQ